ncbi:MAG: hypothetical protein II269_09940, partial [Bacteroidaceae bacterium]|nr:hypothetical protein [Bacteroidaceae bacterium]
KFILRNMRYRGNFHFLERFDFSTAYPKYETFHHLDRKKRSGYYENEEVWDPLPDRGAGHGAGHCCTRSGNCR